MNISGILIEKYPLQEISDTFRKQEFVIEYAENANYPEFIKFEIIQSNCDQLNDLQVGDRTAVTFNLKGRKWTNKEGKIVYFNSLQAWKVEKIDSDNADKPSGNTTEEIPLPDDELPF